MAETYDLSPMDPGLHYSGRIDDTDTGKPLFIYPSSSVAFKFKGTFLKVVVSNYHFYFDNSIGYVLDGKQGKLDLPDSEDQVVLTIGQDLEDTEHEIYLFKRMDGCHYFRLHGFVLNAGAVVDTNYVPAYKASGRRMLFFGDSVTAGEVSEAVDSVGQSDPEHNGQYSNAWYSYAHMTARHFEADIHSVAQGGLALMDGTGWYYAPHYVGLESVYDKTSYSKHYGHITPWDHNLYDPQVIVVALGQNDANPVNFMQADYESDQSRLWRSRYQGFIETLRTMYPEAKIILITTLLNHDPSWDKAIDQVCEHMADPQVLRCHFKRNGCGTPGHLRISEAREMADELCAYIEERVEKIW